MTNLKLVSVVANLKDSTSILHQGFKVKLSYKDQLDFISKLDKEDKEKYVIENPNGDDSIIILIDGTYSNYLIITDDLFSILNTVEFDEILFNKLGSMYLEGLIKLTSSGSYVEDNDVKHKSWILDLLTHLNIPLEDIDTPTFEDIDNIVKENLDIMHPELSIISTIEEINTYGIYVETLTKVLDFSENYGKIYQDSKGELFSNIVPEIEVFLKEFHLKILKFLQVMLNYVIYKAETKDYLSDNLIELIENFASLFGDFGEHLVSDCDTNSEVEHLAEVKTIIEADIETLDLYTGNSITLVLNSFGNKYRTLYFGDLLEFNSDDIFEEELKILKKQLSLLAYTFNREKAKEDVPEFVLKALVKIESLK